MARVLVTGAAGFVGQATVESLLRRGYTVRASSRSVREPKSVVESVVVGEQDGRTDWTEALHDVDYVLHLAGRAHVMRDDPHTANEQNRRVNEEGTARLAEMAALARVRRLIFVSSVKACGEITMIGSPITANCQLNPKDPYGRSKAAAEARIKAVGKRSGMAITIVRPPLVYGPGVGGNFATLLRILSTGIPLPLGAVQNLRSFVFNDNLADFLALCVEAPAAADATFLVSDDEDVSTTSLMRRLSSMLGVATRLLPIPVPLLRAFAAAVAKSDACSRLVDSLQVDMTETRCVLGWSPPHTLDEGLRKTASDYIERSRFRDRAAVR